MEIGDTNTRQSVNLWLICALAALDGMDMAILPAIFRAMEASLAFSPIQLAILAVAQACAHVTSCPAWGCLVDSGFPRKDLIGAAAFGISICSLLLGFVSNFQTMVALRITNGICLGSMGPIAASIVAEESDPSRYGYNFGWIEFSTYGIGTVISSLVITSISNLTVLGVEGWRFGLFAMAFLSCSFAILIRFLMDERSRQWHPERLSIQTELGKLFTYLQIPTFAVLVLLGMILTITTAAMNFATLFFQYLGMADWQAATVTSMLLFGTGLGGLLGGVIGDRFAAMSPSYGRPLTGQISVFLGIPFAAAVFSMQSSEGLMYLNIGGLMFMFGLFSPWFMTGCSKPILLQIVPAGSQASAVGWLLCLENAVGRFIGPLAVGFISEKVFGYTTNVQTREQVDAMTAETRSANAEALGKSLLFTTTLPFAICFVLYGILHYTYRHDVRSEGLLSKESSRVSGADGIVEYSQNI